MQVAEIVLKIQNLLQEQHKDDLKAELDALLVELKAARAAKVQ